MKAGTFSGWDLATLKLRMMIDPADIMVIGSNIDWVAVVAGSVKSIPAIVADR